MPLPVLTRQSKQRAGGRDRGSTSIEAVFIVPCFLAVLLIIVEASLWMGASALAQAAAEDGVRAGTGHDALSSSEAVRATEEILSARPTSIKAWQVTTEIDPSGLTVHVRATAPTVIPGITLTVNQSATMPWESP